MKIRLSPFRMAKKPSQMSEEQHAIYEFTMTLNKDKKISDELYNKTYEILGKDRLVDLVGILGYYTLISDDNKCVWCSAF